MKKNKSINWDVASPKDITLQDLENAKETDFPNTYSGIAWKACWIMYHEGYKKDPEEFLRQDGWGKFPYLHGKNLDLTGFMVGWACNALRFILKKSPVRDGATVLLGCEKQPVGVPSGCADDSLRKTLGGDSFITKDHNFITKKERYKNGTKN